ncbi:MAG: hypothetical protein JSS89_14035 [Bacteroidetes bacterium]|nr:hypothetical protein [Bacteroidota bacterium]
MNKLFSAQANGFAQLETGELYGWCLNGSSAIDTTNDTPILAPRPVHGLTWILDLTSTFLEGVSVVAIDSSGSVLVWGRNDRFKLGMPSPQRIDRPTILPLPSKCVSVKGGITHTLALLEDGTVWAWGDNSDGQLGVDGIPVSQTPIQIEGLHDVAEIAASSSFGLALTRDGELWGWGSNAGGVLRLPDSIEVARTPVRIEPPCIITDVRDAKTPTTKYSVDATIGVVQGVLRITSRSTSGSLQARIYSIHGVLLETFELRDGVSHDLNVEELPIGVYVLALTLGAEQRMSTFLKVK